MSLEIASVTYLLGFALFSAGFVGIEYFGTSDFIKTGFPLIVASIGGYSSDEFFGIVAGTVALPLACASLMWGSWLLLASNRHPGFHAPLSALYLGLASVMYGRWRAYDLVDCGIFLCAFFGPDSKAGDFANGYFQQVSIPLLLVFIALSFLHGYCTVRWAWTRLRPERSSADANEDMSTISSQVSSLTLSTPLLESVVTTKVSTMIHKSRCLSWKTLIAFALLMLIGLLSSILLPNGWLNLTGHKIRVNAIEIVDGESAFRDFKFGYVARPELPEAMFRTVPVKLGRDVVAKVYPDVYLFYGYLILSVFVVRLTPSSLKMIAYLALTAFFFALFTHAWWFHNWHGWWGGVTSFVIKEPTTNEKIARTSGQIVAALLGLLLTLIGRTSPLNALANVSWDRAVVVHRWLGNLFLLVLVVHIGFWWRVFADQGVLHHDALAGVFKSAPSFFPLNMHAKPGDCMSIQCLDPLYNKPAADNFTIPLMNFVTFYVVIPVFGVLTWSKVRRQAFELFYFTHALGAWVLVLSVLWHAAAALVYLLPGLCIVLADHVARWMTSVESSRVSEVRVVPNATQDSAITAITIETTIKCAPGQYIMLNVPHIRPFEFHPFSVSSATALRLHVKSSGEFTRDLARRLRAGDPVHIQGPYGLPPTLRGRSLVVFVAGGIGITPVASLLEGLMGDFDSNERRPQVLLLWVARGGSQGLFFEFQSALDALVSTHSGACKLFETDTSTPIVDIERLERGASLTLGRPNIALEIASFIAQNTLGSATLLVNALLYACGPAALVRDSKTVANELGLVFHEELFEL